jgi:hypothetical protein
MVTVNQVLADARQLIEVHGWIQGSYGQPNCGFCMLGALHKALDDVADRDVSRLDELDQLEQRAVIQLQMAMGPVVDRSARHITLWNDRNGRSKQEVLSLFDLAITAAESTQ